MVEVILSIILAVSLLGVIAILYRKARVLATMPKNSDKVFQNNSFISAAENKIQKVSRFFFNAMLLHKILSWVKCKIIKAETWIDEILHGLRKKAKEQKLNGKK